MIQISFIYFFVILTAPERKGEKSERFKCECVQWELRGDGRCACDFNKWEDD